MNKERVGSLFFLLVGVVVFLLSLRLEIGSLNQPGPAMFPLILSISLVNLRLMPSPRTYPTDYLKRPPDFR